MIVENLDINPQNYRDVARKLSMPYSFFELWLGTKTTTDLEGKAAIYDIETDDKEKFTHGRINDFSTNDPKEFLQHLNTFPISAGFNVYRFDNEVLFRTHREHFTETHHRNFLLHKPTPVNIDLLPAYRLWKPFANTHRGIDLAKDMKIKTKYGLENKEGKCKEDVLAMQKFWPFAKQLLTFIQQKFLIDPETICVQMPYYSKLRRWFLQSWLLQQGILPIPFRKEYDKKPSFYHYHKKGFFKNVNAFDVKSAYPNTAIRLNSTLYKEGDFANYMRYLINERGKCRGKCPECGCNL